MLTLSYKREGNSIRAYFGNLTNNDDAFFLWHHKLSKYFTKHYKSVSAFMVTNILDDVLCKSKVSGMKFYGEAKCHPDDVYSEDMGKYIAKKRLLEKYLRVRVRIAGIIRMNVYKDYFELGRISKIDKKKGW